MSVVPLLLALVSSVFAQLSPEEVLAEVRALDAFRSQRIASAPRIPDIAYTTAASGKAYKTVIAVEGAESGKAYGVWVSSVPIGPLWKAVNDEPHLVGYIPVTESSVLSGTVRGSGPVVFQYLEVPVPGVNDRWWATKVRFNPGLYAASGNKLWELAWREDTSVSIVGTAWEAKVADATMVAKSQGGWLLIPLSDGRTVMEYYTWANPSGSIPKWVADRLGGGAVVDTIHGMEKMAREHIPGCSGRYYYPDGSTMP